MSESFWIQILEPGHPSRVVSVAEETDVGRDCDGIVLDDPTASRRHLRLDPTAVGLVVIDLGSANGTFIDGVRLDEPVVLQPGSRLEVGETEIVVHQPHATAAETGGTTGDELVLDRVSEEARRLNQPVRRGGSRPAAPGGPSAPASPPS